MLISLRKAISWEHTLSEYEHKSVAATFASQLQDLDQQCPDASILLRVITFLDPESIPLEILITGAKALIEAKQPRPRSRLSSSLLALIQSPIARQDAITHLQNRCLVAYHATSPSPTFRIHDLIQLVVLENTKNSGLAQEMFELAVEFVCAALRKIEGVELPEWWPQCELLVPHLQSLTLRQDTSITAKKALLWANYRRGVYLGSRGRFIEAEGLLQNIMADREQHFGLNDSDTLAVMFHLARVYQCRGRHIDAEALFERVLESRKSQLGPEHRDTLMTMYYLGVVYYYQKRFDDAEPLLQQTLHIQESQFDSEDVNTLFTMRLLADVYNSQNRHDEAESLLTRVLQAQEKLFGPEHYCTLNTQNSLADVYYSQRFYDAAAELYQQVLHVSEKLLGLQHPDTLVTMYSLARVYFSQDRFVEAEKLLLPILAGDEQVYGLFHPDTQLTVKLLIRVYRAMERPDDAKMLEQLISSSQR